MLAAGVGDVRRTGDSSVLLQASKLDRAPARAAARSRAAVVVRP